MNLKKFIPLVFVSILLISINACKENHVILHPTEQIATSDRLWTGVAVSEEGRIFVCFPRWEKNHVISVAEVFLNGKIRAYPNTQINIWDSTKSQSDYFVCIQSVFIDKNNNLWVLDAANPMFRGIYINGPKLIKIDLKTNKIVQKIVFATTAVDALSYLNDVRVDTGTGTAYISDSGMGAIIVVDLNNETYRRVLYSHKSTKMENVIIKINDEPIDIKVNVDGIALDKNAEYLYYKSLTGRKLYRIATNWMRDQSMSEDQIANYVEEVTNTGISDGMIFGADEKLYLTSIEQNAITRLNINNEIELISKGEELKWPDSFSVGPDGSLYFTTSQIHLRGNITSSYKLFKIELDK